MSGSAVNIFQTPIASLIIALGADAWSSYNIGAWRGDVNIQIFDNSNNSIVNQKMSHYIGPDNGNWISTFHLNGDGQQPKTQNNYHGIKLYQNLSGYLLYINLPYITNTSNYYTLSKFSKIIINGTIVYDDSHNVRTNINENYVRGILYLSTEKIIDRGANTTFNEDLIFAVMKFNMISSMLKNLIPTNTVYPTITHPTYGNLLTFQSQFSNNDNNPFVQYLPDLKKNWDDTITKYNSNHNFETEINILDITPDLSSGTGYYQVPFYDYNNVGNSQLRNAYIGKLNENSSLKATIQADATQITNLGTLNDSLKSTNSTLQAKIQADATQITGLQSTNSTLQAKIAELQRTKENTTTTNPTTTLPISITDANRIITTIPQTTSNPNTSMFANIPGIKEGFSGFDDLYYNTLKPKMADLSSKVAYNPNVGQLDNSTVNIIQILSDLDAQITALEAQLQITAVDKNNRKTMSGIQSKSSGAKLCTSTLLDKNTNTKTMIKANNGCLSVSGNNNYQFAPCDVNDKKQYFDANQIITENDFAKNIEFGSISPDTAYPFLVMRSQHNGNCVTGKSGGISVEPCIGSVSQQWSPIF